ncbi:MAG TPA: transcription termination/antitermination protein NusG [Pirellulaceae bacterium]|nr:transcription termination/antitermination protein NusG [Pirellulaceae bacterium]
MSSEPKSSDPRDVNDPGAPAPPPVPADAAASPPAPAPVTPAPGESYSPLDKTQPFPLPPGNEGASGHAAAGADDQADPPEIEEPEIEEPEIEEPEIEEPFVPAEPLEFIDESQEQEDLRFDWYILKVQVNREDSIKDALLRRVKMEDKERFFREIVVPTEDMAEFTKTGKRKIVKKKIYPGYILVNMAINDETWFLVRETPGIGDFTGSAGKPTPMLQHDVDRILRTSKVIEDEAGQVRTAIPFKSGDRVRVKEGYFQNFEGDVDAIDQANGRVTVMINIFGRSTPVELEHWQIEKV